MNTHFVERGAKDFFKLNFSSDPWRRNSEIDWTLALTAATSWLLRTIDESNGNASSKGFRFLKGWMPPYPETSGYLIPTLLTLARDEADPTDLARRAQLIADWLIGIQLPNGGFRGGEVGTLQDPDVFDTGMILLGFNSLIHETGDPKVAAAAKGAAEFLVSSLDETGCFVRHLSHDIIHAYNVRSAWGLVAYGRLSGQDAFVEAGMANARWTQRQQNSVGFYGQNAFKKGGNANTHGTAYVMQGLLQIYDLTKDSACLESTVRAAQPLRDLYREHGWIAAELGPDWQYLSRHTCLTGYAQIAIVFLRLFELTGEEDYRRSAESLLRDVASTQDLRRKTSPQYGAIAGSFPIYGRYAPLQYPNWATKFFVDALLAKARVDKGERSPSFLLYGG